MLAALNRLLTIETSDSDDTRRRGLLNVLLAGLLVLVFLGLAVTVYFDSRGLAKDSSGIYISALVAFPSIIALYLINRFKSGLLASSIFLMFLIGIISFSDTAAEVANGRTLFFFVIPVIMASVLLRPYTSFIFAALCSLTIIGLALSINLLPNAISIAGLFAIALVSWLSARSLEQALKDVRTINAELDQRVEDRTRELSESLARESEQASQRQAILQGIADGVVVFDTRGRAILANPAISRLTNLPLDHIIAHNYADIIESASLTNEERETLSETLSSPNASSLPLRVRWGAKTLSVSAAPVQDISSKIIGNVAVFRDFTREAEVEEMKNSFVAMVSHELRTPLNAILGYSEMLRDAFYGPLNDKQENATNRILNNSRRLLDIVSDLLDKAQIEAGHLNINSIPFHAAELTEYLHSVMDKMVQDKGLELRTHIAEDIPLQIIGDSKRIQQVMVNLVNNAAKFTEKGSIRVKIYKVAEEYWAFDVSDTGPGIAAEDQKYIFDPFRQVDKTVTRSHGGIGLGLSIVKRLVDLMGGRIFVKSIVGQGSTFSVILPFMPPQKESEHER